MNLKWILDPKWGGRIRAGLALLIFVGTLAGALANQVDWSAPLTVLVPTVLGVLAHFTTAGDKA